MSSRGSSYEKAESYIEKKDYESLEKCVEELSNDEKNKLLFQNLRSCTAVKKLLEAEANVEAQNKNGVTPLYLACINGYTKTVKILLKKRADVEARKVDGISPLHVACIHGHTEIVELLLAKGANIKALGDRQRTTLHEACSGGYTEIVKILLEKGANIEALSSDRKTPLCVCRDKETCELLVKSGAKLTDKLQNKIEPQYLEMIVDVYRAYHGSKKIEQPKANSVGRN